MPPTPMFPATVYAYNATCGVMPLSPHARHPVVTTPSDAPTWRPHNGIGWPGTVGCIRLGLDRHYADWLTDDTVDGSLLVLRACDNASIVTEAARRGYVVLDLWPLAGRHAWLRQGPRSHQCAHVGGMPSHAAPMDPEFLVGRALADVWCRHPRVVAVGPDWAIDVLASLPGAVVFTPSGETTDASRPNGECRAHGRRWTISGWPGPFEVALRLARPTTAKHSLEDDTIASLLVGTSQVRKRVCAFAERDGAGGLWRVDAGDLGQLTIKRGAGQWYDESIIRWPSNEDPWLVSLVGDGEPLADDSPVTSPSGAAPAGSRSGDTP